MRGGPLGLHPPYGVDGRCKVIWGPRMQLVLNRCIYQDFTDGPVIHLPTLDPWSGN